MGSFHESYEDFAIHINNITHIDSINSGIQKIDIFSHPVLGSILVINGELQTVEKWAPFYHENLVHIPMSFLSEAKTALIIGGGDLFAAKEILKYDSIEQLTLVDYDHNVTDLTIKYFEDQSDILSDPRLRIIEMDGLNFLKANTETYDLVLNDAFDLVEIDNNLNFNKSIYSLFSLNANVNGICGNVSYRNIFEEEYIIYSLKKLSADFDTFLSLVSIPEYPGVFHTLYIWGKNIPFSHGNPVTKNLIQQTWIDNQTNPCLLFNPSFLAYYLYFPPYLRKLIKQ